MLSYENKTILITGCCGTVGEILLKQILQKTSQTKIIGIDFNESKLYYMFQQYKNSSRVSFELCDIRSKQVGQHILRSDIIIHCAAFKHVYFGDRNVEELKSVNIDGTENLLTHLDGSEVTDFIFTSSDKAANPTSTMGVTKLMGERMVAAADRQLKTRCGVVRFGNVIGSSGSVYPIFKEQIKQHRPLTITDENMTRFVMSPSQSADLILDSLAILKGGEIYISKMKALSIIDLADAMIQYFSPKETILKELIGAASQEKMYEELMTEDEALGCTETDSFYVLSLENRERQTFNMQGLRSDKMPLMSFDEITKLIQHLEKQ